MAENIQKKEIPENQETKNHETQNQNSHENITSQDSQNSSNTEIVKRDSQTTVIAAGDEPKLQKVAIVPGVQQVQKVHTPDIQAQKIENQKLHNQQFQNAQNKLHSRDEQNGQNIHNGPILQTGKNVQNQQQLITQNRQNPKSSNIPLTKPNQPPYKSHLKNNLRHLQNTLPRVSSGNKEINNATRRENYSKLKSINRVFRIIIASIVCVALPIASYSALKLFLI